MLGWGVKDRIIEGRYTVVGETVVKQKRRLHPAIRYCLNHPIILIWVAMLTVVGLTEGLW